ncbi:gamma-glutamylcyclotransferase [Pseudomarimonas salicorniae]|uniref:Gamma-glutamylcyclotransferase n=1 Tax=Pseudomarimonas salicorniae TaxID=2933270 RepID=A0ABT0GFS2_9GAMM|nr:gamma-glutamylcyclotransferase [Lysobacter sp. CAU 1642]MCK7592875.1 gamma-glutamylcyclotransferase [Lysobacter sp. CAU 1642]
MAQSSFLYFAYGSNMFSPRLRAASRAPTARQARRASLRGHRLSFDKVGSDDGTGKCDAEWTGDAQDVVHGVLYLIDELDGRALDRAEGLGQGYERATLQVESGGVELGCTTYVATHKDPSLRPLCWYKQLVLAGAREHGLPPDYIAGIEAVAHIDDADLARREAYQRLLRGEA